MMHAPVGRRATHSAPLPAGFVTGCRPGAVLLLLVLIVGSVALTLGLSLALRGILELNVATSALRSQRALAVADGCVEDTLLQLKQSGNYGGGTLAIAGGTCTVTVAGSATQKTIVVVATVETVTRRVNATVSLTPPTPPAAVNTVAVVAWRVSDL